MDGNQVSVQDVSSILQINFENRLKDGQRAF
jgi:hypothetical protein